MLQVSEQSHLLLRLQSLVLETGSFKKAVAADTLIRLPTGDGLALVFFEDAEAPLRCAIEVSRMVQDDSKMKIRMGIHSGQVFRIRDINSNMNVAGGGINMAQRVMDCGEIGHILLSRASAELLMELGQWTYYLHDLGEKEVKHGVRVQLFNFYTDELGNSEPPAGLLRTPSEVQKFQDSLSISERFLKSAGFLITRLGGQKLLALHAKGRLAPFAPLHILVADRLEEQDVLDLVSSSEELGRRQSERASVIIYGESPNLFVRMRMAEVRLRHRVVFIPIPLAAVERAAPDAAESAGLLADYADRYLPGADLFDDRNAIADTLSFFGRTEVLRRLEEHLLKKQSVGIFGLRKSGKTSVLLQLGFILRQFPVVHIDLQPYGGQSFFGTELFNEILVRMSKLIRDRDPGIAQSAKLFPRQAPAASIASQFVRQVSTFADHLTKVGYELPILCFLDEIERVLPAAGDQSEKFEEFNAFFGALRAFSQEQRKLVLLVADVHPDCNRINRWPLDNVPTNPVCNFFTEIFLPPFTESETSTMLNDIGGLMGREFDETTLKRINEQSGGHPFVARQLASLLCTHILPGRQKVEWSKAERYLNDPLNHSGVLRDYFAQSLWADIRRRHPEPSTNILNVLACNESHNGISTLSLNNSINDSGDYTENQVVEALLWLESIRLISRAEGATNDGATNDYYRFQLPLFATWIRREMRGTELKQWRINP